MKYIRDEKGFTLIELVIFIVLMGVVANTVLITFNTMLKNIAPPHKQAIAEQTAMRCLEWFIGQRNLNGYDSIPCPSNTVPNFCTVPNGYTISVNVECTTLYGDANYKTINISVSGDGEARARALLANY